MEETARIELPDDAKELADFSEFSAAYLTVNRSPDGSVYLTRWWYGSPYVVLVVRPDGAVQKSPEE
jgi:hypothetical protein